MAISVQAELRDSGETCFVPEPSDAQLLYEDYESGCSFSLANVMDKAFMSLTDRPIYSAIFSGGSLSAHILVNHLVQGSRH